jgi:hypothetical protein
MESEHLDELKNSAGWPSTPSDAREWWLQFEAMNDERPELVRHVLKLVVGSGRTIAEFFNVYAYSDVDDIAVLCETFERLATSKEGDITPEYVRRHTNVRS